LFRSAEGQEAKPRKSDQHHGPRRGFRHGSGHTIYSNIGSALNGINAIDEKAEVLTSQDVQCDDATAVAGAHTALHIGTQLGEHVIYNVPGGVPMGTAAVICRVGPIEGQRAARASYCQISG